MIIKQIRSADNTGTLSYIVIDDVTKQAAIIDPNIEDISLLNDEIRSLGVTVTSLIDTHTHADHISGIAELQSLTGATVFMHSASKDKYKFANLGDAFGVGGILRENVKVVVDQYVNDGDRIPIGGISITVVHTPGHTNDHICLLVDGHLFTGDLLLIGQAGRSDLPSGNTDEQYDSLFNMMMSLPDETIIHPGHDYEGNESSTIVQEKLHNPFLESRSKEEYREFVHEFFPPMADVHGDKVLLQCGAKRISQEKETFKNISAEDLKTMISADKDLVLLDVREPSELAGIGAINGVVNIPISSLIYGNTNLQSFEGKKIVVVCHTGGRSLEAAHYLTSKGFKNIHNLVGGTLGWMVVGYSVTRKIQKGAFT